MSSPPEGYFKLSMEEPNRMTDDLYDEMAADPMMRTALGLGENGPEDLGYGPGPVEKLGDGVLRIGHSEETTDCWWRVTNPAALLGGGAASAPSDGRRELLGTVAKELTAARHQLQSFAFDHPNTPHASSVRFREKYLHKATLGVNNALRVVEAAKVPRVSCTSSRSHGYGRTQGRPFTSPSPSRSSR
jgi:hypothetical protein